MFDHKHLVWRGEGPLFSNRDAQRLHTLKEKNYYLSTLTTFNKSTVLYIAMISFDTHDM